MAIHQHPLYHRWKDINQACSSPNNPNYAWAGARGIQVKFADFWEFVNFIETELGMPQPGHRLHRIDQDGHYEPGNLTWSTSKEISIKSLRLHKKFIITDFCRQHGFRYSTVRARLDAGQTPEDILKNPPPKH